MICFKLFSYSKMIPWEADIAMLFGAMLLFTLGKVTNKLHVASFCSSLHLYLQWQLLPCTLSV